jgi:hypothetical protein
MAFGPAGILFLADNAAATVFAIDIADPGPEGGSEPFDLVVVCHRPARPASPGTGRVAFLIPPPRCFHHERALDRA